MNKTNTRLSNASLFNKKSGSLLLNDACAAFFPKNVCANHYFVLFTPHLPHTKDNNLSINKIVEFYVMKPAVSFMIVWKLNAIHSTGPAMDISVPKSQQNVEVQASDSSKDKKIIGKRNKRRSSWLSILVYVYGDNRWKTRLFFVCFFTLNFCLNSYLKELTYSAGLLIISLERASSTVIARNRHTNLVSMYTRIPENHVELT